MQRLQAVLDYIEFIRFLSYRSGHRIVIGAGWLYTNRANSFRARSKAGGAIARSAAAAASDPRS
jgi:hypothetical protein